MGFVGNLLFFRFTDYLPFIALCTISTTKSRIEKSSKLENLLLSAIGWSLLRKSGLSRLGHSPVNTHSGLISLFLTMSQAIRPGYFFAALLTKSRIALFPKILPVRFAFYIQPPQLSDLTLLTCPAPCSFWHVF